MKYLLCLLLAGCTSTTIYKNGKPVLRTEGDIVGLEMVGDNIRIAKLDHSSATRAAASGITAAGSAVAATGLATLLK